MVEKRCKWLVLFLVLLGVEVFLLLLFDDVKYVEEISRQTDTLISSRSSD